jgi:hypothetical protein
VLLVSTVYSVLYSEIAVSRENVRNRTHVDICFTGAHGSVVGYGNHDTSRNVAVRFTMRSLDFSFD